MLMALFQNKESLSSNKTTRVCGQADKNVQLQARPRGLIGVRREINLLLHPIVIRRLTSRLFSFKQLCQSAIHNFMCKFKISLLLYVCCIIEIQKVAEQSAESCICILHKVAGFMERIAFDHYGIQVEPAFSP